MSQVLRIFLPTFKNLKKVQFLKQKTLKNNIIYAKKWAMEFVLAASTVLMDLVSVINAISVTTKVLSYHLRHHSVCLCKIFHV